MSDSENRKAATIRLARELYELMPDAPSYPTGPNGEIQWGVLEVTKHYSFCMLIAARIIAADCRVFK